MKLKKLKKLVGAINDITKRDITTVKGITNTGIVMDNGQPIILLPTKGKNCLPEVKVINKIITSIKPEDWITEAPKVNIQAQMKILSITHDKNASMIMIMVHTPYGICAYSAPLESNNGFKEVEGNVSVEFDKDFLQSNYEIM